MLILFELQFHRFLLLISLQYLAFLHDQNTLKKRKVSNPVPNYPTISYTFVQTATIIQLTTSRGLVGFVVAVVFVNVDVVVVVV